MTEKGAMMKNVRVRITREEGERREGGGEADESHRR